MNQVNKTALTPGDEIGSMVTVNFGSAGAIGCCTVIRVHFTESKVCYDLQVNMSFTHETAFGEKSYEAHTRIYNIDSAFISKVV